MKSKKKKEDTVLIVDPKYWEAAMEDSKEHAEIRKKMDANFKELGENIDNEIEDNPDALFRPDVLTAIINAFSDK
ncbi:MAG: hypothetical protein II399_05530 [Lachnospiraceae bacterium]|nr:hypothetical protein [Lachnospiraceae bacterium]